MVSYCRNRFNPKKTAWAIFCVTNRQLKSKFSKTKQAQASPNFNTLRNWKSLAHNGRASSSITHMYGGKLEFLVVSFPTLMQQVTSYTGYENDLCLMSLLFQIMDGFLEDYNVSSKAPMDLVLFRFAIEHVSRICRVLRQPNGHALLVGMNKSVWSLSFSNPTLPRRRFSYTATLPPHVVSLPCAHRPSGVHSNVL